MHRNLILMILLASLLLTGPAIANTPPPADRLHASILMYHHISIRTPPSTSTSPERFKEHLDLLERDGFQIWPLDRVVQHLQRRRPMPDKVAAITFDDGFISIYENALPLLKERQLPFTIFVNAQPIKERHPLHMTWSQLKEAQQAGGIIANHGLTHGHMIRQLEGESEADWLVRMTHEIEENQREIEQNLGSAPKLFAFPYGEYNPALQDLIRRLGYIGFGQQSGPASPFTSLASIPRYAANGIYANPDTLRTKLHALPFPLLSEEPAATVLSGQERRPQLVLTLAPGDYRLRQLACYGPDSQTLPVRTRTLSDGNVRVEVDTARDLPTGRPRYNCTAPHATENRYFWFTRQWLLPHPDGTWYQD